MLSGMGRVSVTCSLEKLSQAVRLPSLCIYLNPFRGRLIRSLTHTGRIRLISQHPAQNIKQTQRTYMLSASPCRDYSHRRFLSLGGVRCLLDASHTNSLPHLQIYCQWPVGLTYCIREHRAVSRRSLPLRVRCFFQQEYQRHIDFSLII
jgi:hypothetical protein